jgi:hypothetical protein
MKFPGIRTAALARLSFANWNRFARATRGKQRRSSAMAAGEAQRALGDLLAGAGWAPRRAGLMVNPSCRQILDW